MELPLDFMLLEVYYNSTAGYTFNRLHKQFYMSAFSSRRLIELSLAINVDYRRTMKPVGDILYRIDSALCAIPYYKKAGADLGALAFEQPWQEISKDRMNDVKSRFKNDCEGVHELFEYDEAEKAVPLLMASSPFKLRLCRHFIGQTKSRLVVQTKLFLHLRINAS